MKIVHTSAKFKVQIYIPEVNYLLMLACMGVTLGFKDPKKIGCCGYNDTNFSLAGTHYDNYMEIQHVFHTHLRSYHWLCGVSLLKFSPLQI